MLSKSKTLIAIFLILSFAILNAQEKKSDCKISKLKGKVESITIKTDKDELKLTGKEAEKIVKMIKDFKHKNHKNVFFISDDHKAHKNMSKNFTWVTADSDNEKKVELKVTKENDVLTINEIVYENGEKTEKTYTGKEAEEFLKKHEKSSQGKHIKIIADCDSDVEWIDDKDVKVYVTKKGNKNLFIHKDDICDSIMKKIEIKIGDDKEIKVIEEKFENGKTVVKEYIGEKAKKYIEKHGHKGENVFFFDSKSNCDDETISINVEVEDGGEKIIKVKTIKNGEEDVKIYKGEAAEKFLKEHKKGDKKIIEIKIEKKEKEKK